jgi:hypothetical protein
MMREVRNALLPFRHHFLTIAFLLGFILDNITLGRVDRLFDNIVLLGYLLIATIALQLLYAGSAGRLGEWLSDHVGRYAPYLVQFSFGGLMSGLLVFYSRSGSWLASWPFLLLMFAIILGNECITKRASRLVFNLSVFFLALFSYIALIMPVVLGRMGDSVFLMSGACAVFVFAVFVKVLYFVVPNFMALNTRTIIITTCALYAFMNALYFTNMIPPIPLAIKEVGIYHKVEKREAEGYVLSYEQGPWYALWKKSDSTFHLQPGDVLYCYASVFAPARFETAIRHRWEYYDQTSERWREYHTETFSIEGGRDSGYRGYSYITNVAGSHVRCSVETLRGQVIARAKVEVVRTDRDVPLVTRVDI